MEKTIYENESTPKADGFHMPGEHEPQERIWMLWPHRTDNWQYGAKPAQQVFADVARAIAHFEPVTIGVKPVDYAAAHCLFKNDQLIDIVEMESDDAWIRDCGPAFVVNDSGDLRAVHFGFNAWGGLHDGLYFPWNQDELVGMKVCDLAHVDRYKPDNFILEGGSFTVDGEGTVITTEMCLLSLGRNPHYTKGEIEQHLCDYLGCEKVIWVKDGIDPDETNGHIDGVATYVAPGEVACIWTDDTEHPYYQVAQDAFTTLSTATDAKGRKLKVHKLCMGANPIALDPAAAATIDTVDTAKERTSDYEVMGSYLNFLIVNGGVIVPQYDDPNDELAIEQIQGMFPDREIVGVNTTQILYGGGNIHCITQQQPKPQRK